MERGDIDYGMVVVVVHILFDTDTAVQRKAPEQYPPYHQKTQEKRYFKYE